MTLEAEIGVGAALGAGLLLLAAAAAQGIALFKTEGRWALLALGSQGGGAAVLAVALALTAVAYGGWSPFDLRQAAWSLALAALLIHLALAWRTEVYGAGPVVALAALALVLMGVFVIQPGSPPPTCAQLGVPFLAQWLLFLLGAGGAIVAGSASLAAALYTWLAGRDRVRPAPRPAELGVVLRRAVALALVALGGGLAVGAWWAWRTVGALTSGDPREGWMVVAWLTAAMSRLAWRLGRRAGRWAAALALVAAAVAILGLLAITDLRQLLGL